MDHPGKEHERAVMAASLCLAAASTVLGTRVHRRASPLLLVGAGALVWLATFMALPVPEAAPTIAASLLMAAGTLWSARLRHVATCPRCGCAAHTSGGSAPSTAAGRPLDEEAGR